MPTPKVTTLLFLCMLFGTFIGAVKGIKCHDQMLKEQNRTDCYPHDTGCAYITGCQRKYARDFIGCYPEDLCDLETQDGKTTREVCEKCFWCTTDMCNDDGTYGGSDPPNGAAGIVGWGQIVIIPIGMMTMVFGAGILKMLAI